MDDGVNTCDVSPFCGRAGDLVGALGLPADRAWRWAHLGPVGPHTVPLVEHRGRCLGLASERATTPELGRFLGYHLDLLGMLSPPPVVGASYHPPTGLWYVYAVAWRTPDEPRVEWRAERAGPGELLIRQSPDLVTPDADAVAARCRALLLGRAGQRGRPRKSAEDVLAGAALGVQAELIRARHPHRTWRSIARDVGADERTLRRLRADARRVGLVVDHADGAVEIRRLA